MKNGLYANIHAKRARIEAGSGEKMKKSRLRARNIAVTVS